MNFLVLALLFILSGFFMKCSDDFFDVNQDVRLASAFGVLCAVASALATISNNDAAYIFIAILIGNLLAFKVDGVHHILTLAIFVLVCLICGIPSLSIIILLICILAALGDEVGHELISRFTDNKFLNLFFEYRFLMKIVLLALVICGVFDIWIFACFILFEIAYVIAGIVFEKYF